MDESDTNDRRCEALYFPPRECFVSPPGALMVAEGIAEVLLAKIHIRCHRHRHRRGRRLLSAVVVFVEQRAKIS